MESVTELPALPPRCAFRFCAGQLRVPQSVSELDAYSGLDPALALAQLGEPQFCFPTLDGQATVWVYADDAGTPLPAEWKELPVRTAITFAANRETPVSPENLFRAWHVAQWRENSRYCGRCGSLNIDASDELARLCPTCGQREYTRISPAIIVLITRDDGCALLASNFKFRKGVYSLVAGFVEAGETLEQTVAREIREEVGIEVKNITYLASQPWPFPASLMLAFTAQWAAGDPRPDKKEIDDARWFSKDNLPELPGKGSISRTVIDYWLKRSPCHV